MRHGDALPRVPKREMGVPRKKTVQRWAFPPAPTSITMEQFRKQASLHGEHNDITAPPQAWSEPALTLICTTNFGTGHCCVTGRKGKRFPLPQVALQPVPAPYWIWGSLAVLPDPARGQICTLNKLCNVIDMIYDCKFSFALFSFA